MNNIIIYNYRLKIYYYKMYDVPNINYVLYNIVILYKICIYV